MNIDKDLIIRAVDTALDSDMQGLNELSSACNVKLYGHPTHMSVEQRRTLLAPSPYEQRHRWVAIYRDQLVGIVSVLCPLKENLDLIDFGLAVHPELENRGIELALTQHALDHFIAASPRTRMNYFAFFMQDEDPQDPQAVQNRVAGLLGLSPKNTAITRIAPLPLAESTVSNLQAKLVHSPEHTIELWEDGVPEEHLESFGLILRQLEIDEPLGDAAPMISDYTPERVRFMEQRIADEGEKMLVAVALVDQKVVAASFATYSMHATNVSAWQNSTVVMPEHRGKGLSRLLKYRTHTRLPHIAPYLTQIITMNSQLNPKMISVNEELGYQATWQEVSYQR